MWFEFTLLLLVFVLYLGFRKRRPKTFPPGPLSWPILGNFVNVGLEPHKSIMSMRKKYGDIIGIDLGPKRSVFITQHDLIKEAFSLISLCGRPPFPHYLAGAKGYRGIATTSEKVWMEQRRFIFSSIQTGFRSGEPVENLILKESNVLVQHLQKKCGRSISTAHLFNVPVVNVLWGIVAGERYEMTDANFLKILEHVNKYLSSIATQGILVFFFKWAELFPKISGYQYFKDNYYPVLDYMQEIIDRHKETYQEGIQRDLIDCYLQKIRNTTDEKSSFFGKTGEENLQRGLHDIFAGGNETAATTLRWLVFLMAFHPEIQEKLSNNISEHMHQRKEPLLKDREILPFVEAVIMEVLRYSSIAPVGIFHSAVDDVQFHGYLIPKGTMVIANQYGAHFDPQVWGDPENFRPERFLTEDQREVIRHPAFLAFSAGRRVCPGEVLGRDELFIFTVKLFHSFKVEFDPNEPIPTMKHVAGSVLAPVDHRVIFSERS